MACRWLWRKDVAVVKQPGVQSAALSCDHHMNIKTTELVTERLMEYLPSCIKKWTLQSDVSVTACELTGGLMTMFAVLLHTDHNMRQRICCLLSVMCCVSVQRNSRTNWHMIAHRARLCLLSLTTGSVGKEEANRSQRNQAAPPRSWCLTFKVKKETKLLYCFISPHLQTFEYVESHFISAHLLLSSLSPGSLSSPLILEQWTSLFWDECQLPAGAAAPTAPWRPGCPSSPGCPVTSWSGLRWTCLQASQSGWQLCHRRWLMLK